MDIIQAQDGAFWLASLGQEALRLDISDDRWMTLEGLNFGCETRDRSLWFISADSGVVRYDGRRWMRYGVEDGLMDLPTALLSTRDGGMWAAGSHDSTAATARFEGSGWVLETHPELSWSVGNSVFEAMDGSLWFGAGNSPSQERGETGGLMQYDGATWHHHGGPSGAPWTVYGIGQISENALWAGSYSLFRYDGHSWTLIDDPPEFANTFVDAIYSDRKAGLWVGTRAYGVFHYEGQSWARYGLGGTRVNSLTSLGDGSVLAASDEGITRFDGRTWTSKAFPADVAATRVRLKTSSDGSLWINNDPSRRDAGRGTVRYRPETIAPQTRLTLFAKVVSQPGNTTLAWEGADPWKATPNEEIQYAHRLDDGDWSAFSYETSHIFQALASGDHSFEVKARDRDFNEDATPATASFTVVAPVWQQGWFIGMVIVFVGGIGFQTSRVIRRDRRLREANEAMSNANHELFGLNRELQRERAGERVRAEVSSMKTAENLQDVIQEMLKELSEAGVVFDLCVINILDEEAGVRRQYGTTKDGVSGQTEHPLSEVSDDFMLIYREEQPVLREVDDAVAAACAATRRALGIEDEDGRPTAVVDAPFSYGTLSLQTRNENGFSEEDVAFVGEFARVISLGYARYLDFQNLEKKNVDLQREQVLERLRGQAQGMQSSEDIGPVVEAVHRELTGLGLPLIGSSILIRLSDTEVEVWTTALEDGRALEPVIVELPPPESPRPVREARHRGDDYYHSHLEGEEVKETLRRYIAWGNPRWKGVPEEQWPRKLDMYFVFFDDGSVSLFSDEHIAEEYLMLIKRFGEVFGFAHSRYKELQEKEAQNRRLAVDASVQRLRAEVQSMDEASDFERILSLLTTCWMSLSRTLRWRCLKRAGSSTRPTRLTRTVTSLLKPSPLQRRSPA